MPILLKDDQLNEALAVWGSRFRPPLSKTRLAYIILESAVQSCDIEAVREDYGAEKRWAHTVRGGPRNTRPARKAV